jgi:hypothetical protein
VKILLGLGSRITSVPGHLEIIQIPLRFDVDESGMK